MKAVQGMHLQVVRMWTLGQAITECFGKVPERLLKVWPKNSFEVCNDFFSRPLEPFGPEPYEQSLWLVGLEQNMTDHDFRLGLKAIGYEPASASESFAYLAALRKSAGPMESLFHMGLHLVGTDFEQYCLKTGERGEITFVTYLHHLHHGLSHSNQIVVRKLK